MDPRVTAIREEVEEAYKLFLSAGKESTMRDHYKEKKEQLYNMYATIDQEELTSKVAAAEQAHASSRHSEAWKLINDISGRHCAQSSKLKANSPEERVKLWYTHFSNLLGSPPQISEEDTPILTVRDALDISEEPFSLDEFLQAFDVGKHVARTA